MKTDRSLPPCRIPVLFPKGTKVRHLKSGGVYEILETPGKLRIEATGAPAYLYSDGDNQWVRPQAEMEDGRFVVDGLE